MTTPSTLAVLGMTTPSGRLFRGTAGASNLIHPDLARIEPPGRGDHLVDRLVEVCGRLPLEPQRVDASDHEGLEVRALEAALLEARDGRVHSLVELEQLVRTLAPRFDRLRELGAEKLVAALEHRVERGTGEAAVLLVAEAERDERGLLELDGEVALRPIVERRERLRQPRHLERPLAEIVRLLGVEEEDTMGDFGLRNHERHDRLGAQLLHGA